ncbi:MAG: type II toxin-antitoxin system death-on-curing family toxin [Humibacillus sp.]|nr:type II toxin-antitoxin system death-on-curing family toxin [Humibacillus sp.]MDN5778486.1 type II toxin-antitoxin system death-on-curing family toxin [Humibacillus sp.]
MTAVRYLNLDSVLSLIKSLGAGPVRDIGLLDSAVGRPQATAFGEDAYPSLDRKAAALLASIAGNHALVDGNKRLAWLSTVVFLDLNGYEPALSSDEAFDLVMDVASGLHEVETIAKRLCLVKT